MNNNGGPCASNSHMVSVLSLWTQSPRIALARGPGKVRQVSSNLCDSESAGTEMGSEPWGHSQKGLEAAVTESWLNAAPHPPAFS